MPISRPNVPPNRYWTETVQQTPSTTRTVSHSIWSLSNGNAPTVHQHLVQTETHDVAAQQIIKMEKSHRVGVVYGGLREATVHWETEVEKGIVSTTVPPEQRNIVYTLNETFSDSFPLDLTNLLPSADRTYQPQPQLIGPSPSFFDSTHQGQPLQQLPPPQLAPGTNVPASMPTKTYDSPFQPQMLRTHITPSQPMPDRATPRLRIASVSAPPKPVHDFDPLAHNDPEEDPSSPERAGSAALRQHKSHSHDKHRRREPQHLGIESDDDDEDDDESDDDNSLFVPQRKPKAVKPSKHQSSEIDKMRRKLEELEAEAAMGRKGPGKRGGRRKKKSGDETNSGCRSRDGASGSTGRTVREGSHWETDH